MSGPPPPFRRKKPSGGGYNAVKAKQSQEFHVAMPVSGFASRYQQLSTAGSEREDPNDQHESASPKAKGSDEEGYDPLMDELPETAIGDGVDIRGELQFDRLLRVDGTFEGKLDSTGSIVVGRKGCLMSDVIGMETLIIDGGKVIGNVQVDRLIMRGSAFLQGNLSCKTLYIGPHCAVIGRSNVHNLAPEIIDDNGGIIILEKGVSEETYYAQRKANALAASAASLNAKQKVPSSRVPSQRPTDSVSVDAPAATPVPPELEVASASPAPAPSPTPAATASSGLGSPRQAVAESNDRAPEAAETAVSSEGGDASAAVEAESGEIVAAEPQAPAAPVAEPAADGGAVAAAGEA